MQRRTLLAPALATTAASTLVRRARAQTTADGGGTPEQQAQRLATQREDLEVSIKYTQGLVARLS